MQTIHSGTGSILERVAVKGTPRKQPRAMMVHRESYQVGDGDWMSLEEEEPHCAHNAGGHSSSHNNDPDKYNLPRSQSFDHAQWSAPTANAAPGNRLNSSFDFSLLTGEKPEPRQPPQLPLTPIRCAASWDESDGTVPTKMRALEADDSFASDAPATVRKLSRGAALLSTTKTPRYHSLKTVARLTPLSVKRRRSAQWADGVPPLTPRIPAASAIRLPFTDESTPTTAAVSKRRPPKVSLGTTATASSTNLETTFDSTDTIETSAPFRFTSFPASLPRISTTIATNGALLTGEAHPHAPATLRKRMTFAESVDFSRDSHNTSLSSFLEEANYNYSDDEDDVNDNNNENHQQSPKLSPTPRARLDFNALHSPRQTPSSPFFASTSEHSRGPLVDTQTTNMHLSLPVLSRDIDISAQDIHMHFQLDHVQYSPIPGRTDEEVESSKCSRETTALETISSVSTARPMPDLTAFEIEADCSIDESLGHKLTCPPTPVRTPAWAHFNNEPRKNAKLQDSLTATRLLATREHAGCNIQDHDHHNENHHRHVPNQATCNVMSDGGIKQSFLATDFEVISLLGRGAFADVYKVQSKSDSKYYALKRNRRQFRGKRDRDLVLLEVQHMQRLQSATTVSSATNPYLLCFVQAWQQDGYFNCLTELCCRATCHDLIDSFRNQNNPFRKINPIFELFIQSLPLETSTLSKFGQRERIIPETTIWKILHDVVSGLYHVHSHGLVHNDIKPSNIFFVVDSRLGAICKIGDFGMTREQGSKDDGEEGDQKYMAPETLGLGNKDFTADLFSLGLSIYELAAKPGFTLPTDGPRWHDLRAAHHVIDLPESRSVILRRMISACMEVKPSDRPSAKQILSHERVVAGGAYFEHFLYDYIHAIESHELAKEKKDASCRLRDDMTPQTSGRPRLFSLNAGTLPPTLLYSPEAVLM